MDGLYTLGTDAKNGSVRVPLDGLKKHVEEAADDLRDEVSSLSELLGGRPIEKWFDAIVAGRAVRDHILANIRIDNLNQSGSATGLTAWGIDGWGGHALSITQNGKPWICPPIDFPAPDDKGRECTMARMFSGCSNLLYVAPMKVPGISLYATFQSCTSLRKPPSLDTSAIRDFTNTFYGDSNIDEWPDWDFSKATTLHGFMSNATKLTEVPDVNLPEVTDMGMWLWSNKALRRIGVIKAPKCSIIYMNGDSFPNLEYVGELDYGSLASHANVYDRNVAFDLAYSEDCPNLRYLRIINLGKGAPTDYYLAIANWGEGSDENRQSMVDTLLTYSYDRASAGKSKINVTMADDAIARLKDEEIAAITAKGISIINHLPYD